MDLLCAVVVFKLNNYSLGLLCAVFVFKLSNCSLGLLCAVIVQLLSKIFPDSDFCHNYLHTPYMFVRLRQTHSLLYVGLFSTVMIPIYLLTFSKKIRVVIASFSSTLRF